MVFYRSYYKLSPLFLPEVVSFEYICSWFTIFHHSGYLLVGLDRPTSWFYEEFTEILEILVLQFCPVIIGGDFNIHVQKSDDELCSTLDLCQHVTEETHRAHKTLNLFMTSPETVQRLLLRSICHRSSQIMPASSLCIVYHK